MSKTKQTFKKMIDVNTPIIYIQDYDFVRVDEIIKDVIGESNYKSAIEWNPALGQIQFWSKASQGMSNMGETSLTQFLRSEVYSRNTIINPPTSVKVETRYVILRDIQDLIDDPQVKCLLQLIAQRKLYDRHFDTTIIIVSSVMKVPQEIDKYVSMLEIDFPSDDEIRQLIDEHIETNDYDPDNFKEKDNLMSSLKGLTKFEIDRMLDMAMSRGGTLSNEDKEQILTHKKQMVKKSGVLELIDSPDDINSIGGLTILKEYLNQKKTIINDLGEALKFGVAVPKGVFVVGMPGCGKSLCAKATASLFEQPLLKMDMGSLMGKYVGESEENLRKAIRIAEAASPCVLWIDEIEKAFNGVGGQNSEVLTRMFGYFLSWMQEKTSSVYVIATANNATNLPPELKRKGRFDEIFCVNLPNKEEREAIFQVHLKKRGKENINITDGLIRNTDGFNGADIESVVNDAIEYCFREKKTLTADVLESKAKETISISMSCKKQIEEMTKVFKEDNFKDASQKQKAK